MRFLLDTCVLSEVVKPEPNPGVTAWLDAADEYTLYLSVLTLGEIQKGVSGLPAGQRKQRLQSWLDRDLRDRFSGRVVAVSDETATEWGLLAGEAKQKGIAAPVIDTLLAATARQHNLVLVTRNIKDFEPFSVHLLNPWS
ncbi:type II toxin-antitoxin system VapC family toxin [Marinimicrobium sp. ARAG 43.8]|uniref:type II toxin-antitoxin system VapC family toxin n=1 Tax=Marinimicrobium sp. ARAG 43.8 TaxID=3418719 RepID=UPI003CE68766